MPKILGITDEVTTCDCCGRAGLKKTVALDFDGNQVYYGSDCAAAAIYGKKSSGNRSAVVAVAKAVSYAQKWIGSRPVSSIANVIRVYWCAAHIDGDSIIIDGLKISR